MAFTRCRQKYAVARRELKDKLRIRRKAVYRIAADSFVRRYFLLAGSALRHALFMLWQIIVLLACTIAGSLKLLPVWLWQILRFCPGKKNRRVKEFYIIGHRGTAAHEVENTLESCAKALQIGANALEIDLSLTEDNRPVLWHDWDPDDLLSRVRQAGLEPNVKYRPFVPMRGPFRRPVHRLTLDQLRAHYGYSSKQRPPRKLDAAIPTLEQFLEWAEMWPQLKLVLLDIKVPEDKEELAREMAQQIKALVFGQTLSFKIMCLSPYRKIVEVLKSEEIPAASVWDIALPPVVVLDPEEFSAVKKAEKISSTVASAGRPTILNLAPWTTYRRLVDHDLGLLHKSSDVISFLSWTINRKREMRCLMRKGVHGIISDRPGRLRKVSDGL